VFLTGVAGSGKSFLIQKYVKNLDPKYWPVLASTGAAAIRVNGRTFHSFFGLGIMDGGFDATLVRALKDKRVVRRLKRVKGIIIDEISMLPAIALRAAEEIARFARESEEPWGGLRVIVVGDFFQLPPVTRSQSSKPWAFLDNVWERSNFKPEVLKTVIRTKDDDFLRVLNKIRVAEIDSEVRDFLDSKVESSYDDFYGTRLFARRDQTEKFNLHKLSEIPGPVVDIKTLYSGREMSVKVLKKQAPIPEVLRLKPGALVMIRQNDPKGRWVNGSLGTLNRINKDNLLIELHGGEDIEITKSEFSLLDNEGKVAAVCSNYPVNLAYATTIHKSQGATYSKLLVDLRSLWEVGQAYVALSRLESSDGLALAGWSESSFKVDSMVQRLHQSLED